MAKTDIPNSQSNRVESQAESPFNRLENTAGLNAKDKAKLVEDLIKNLAKLPATDTLRGFVKTLQKIGIRKNDSENISAFLGKMPKSLTVFLQKTLQKAGYDLSFRLGGREISGPRACDGHWGDASQTAWFAFLKNEEKQRHIKTYPGRVSTIETRLRNIVATLPEKSLPQGFQKNRKLTAKGTAVLKVLALADAKYDSNMHGLLFSTESDNTETDNITTAIKTLWPIVKVGVVYKAQRDYPHGLSPNDRAIDLNGRTIILWGEQATQTTPESLKERGKMRRLSPEEKKIFLAQELDYFRSELKKMKTELQELLAKEEMPYKNRNTIDFKLNEYLRLAGEIAKQGGRLQEGSSIEWLIRDESGKSISAYNNLPKFYKLINKELRLTANEMHKEDCLSPEMGGLIEKMKQKTGEIYQRVASAKQDPSRVSDSYYRKVMKTYQKKEKFSDKQGDSDIQEIANNLQ